MLGDSIFGSGLCYPAVPWPAGQDGQLLVNHVSGDGGNRTRVRKIRASEIYERSRLIMLTQGASTGADYYPEPAA